LRRPRRRPAGATGTCEANLLEAGAFTFLPMPFKVEQLVGLINRACAAE
jgi:DNA-binding NtrC family response regulator